MTSQKATLIGLIAVVLWSTIVGLVRSVSEGFGAVGGAAMIYTLSSVMLFITVGFPKIKTFPVSYLITGSILFVCYELCLSLSLGYANNSTQAIEVSMVNYLWPSLTILLSVWVNRQKTSLVIIPGMLLALMGIGWVLGGDKGLSLSSIINNLYSNPLSYGLAFGGAIIWAMYCAMTKKIANGANGITLFFILTALTLWVNYLLAPQPEFIISMPVIISLILAAGAMGFGYAAWNIGILHGNVTVLATASYLIPVISAALAAFILNSTLTVTFWQGAAMVSLGSLLCWWSTRSATVENVSEQAN
ncbi:aromatic amino acid DMT transporter YddG [Pectobacterium versatile]|uniref:aromatic amino acid DMT transporter YddG n=1 Tax=Pectobacterium versatile TaxID=2488639 RepID=UPI000CDEA803|nr:aromatic amino acid DMT transporter YddG [Pectobacterium versatile]POY56523.1 aromatic amino acid exporter [Pectobacterium versatile]TAI81237.1 drug/metabolite DMT transporter permease [Pectobacterium versatile]